MKIKKIELNREEEKTFNLLIKKYKINPIIAKYLAKKGIDDFERYLKPTYDKLDDIYKIKDLKKAKKLILDKINKKEADKILVVGDYDTDGITASSVMYWFFKNKFNIELNCYIPERVEGYGLKEHIIDYAIENKFDFIITVDNGIAAVSPVQYAKDNNLTVIITDHHQIQDGIIPNADAVLNSVQLDCEYRDKYISGVGMAWNLCRSIDEKVARDLLPIVAIGTIADVVPLVNENRIFVNEGIKTYIKSKYLGLHKLLDYAKEDDLTSTNIGFKIAPIINSAGREGFARKAFELLTATDEKIVDSIFNEMLEHNQDRKIEQKKIEDDLFKTINLKDKYSLTFYPTDYIFNPAVVGIVASKIVERYKLPTIIFSEKETVIDGEKEVVYTGSARGVKWFDFLKLISKMKEEGIFLVGGGHKLAAGLSIQKHNLPKFTEIFNELAKETYEEKTEREVYEIIELPEDKPTTKNLMKSLYKDFKILEPIGERNRLPRIAYNIGNYKEHKFLGKDKKHFSVRTESGIRMLAWNKVMEDKLPDLTNKLFVSDIIESSFETDEGYVISFLEFNIKDIVEEKK